MQSLTFHNQHVSAFKFECRLRSEADILCPAGLEKRERWTRFMLMMT